MTPLSSRLDDTAFDALLALARRRLPGLAPEWTDYNYHDPGITILELLAWVADSQIYSLGRNRLDERLAMASLLGVRPAGAIACRGVVYPLESPGTIVTIRPDDVLKPFRDSAPRLEAAAEITVLPIEISRIETRDGEAVRTDHTETNRRARAPFEAFGTTGNGSLWIYLRDVGAMPAGNEKVTLSLGIELQPKSGASEPSPQVLAPIEVVDEQGRALKLILDTTSGLLRNGVLVIKLPAKQVLQPIVIRPKAGYPLRPTLLQILPNALPVEQRATFKSDRLGNGRPGQEIFFTPVSLFDADEPVEGRVWRLMDGKKALRIKSSDGSETAKWRPGRLDDAGPGECCYSMDERADGSRLAVRFGNGINGRRPGLDDQIKVSLRLSCGRQGEIRKPVEWVLARQGTRWRNASAIGGGRDAQSVRQAISAANARLRDGRVLTTSEELLRALAPLKKPLRIDRAEVEEGWERGLKRPRITATRTLIVGHEKQGAESAAWLGTIRRALADRIAVGERLIVAPPRYVPFTLSVEAVAAPGCDAETTKKAIAKELKTRFKPEKIPWPLGRDVDPIAVAGWVRAVEGVGPSVRVRITADGEERDPLSIGRGALPEYRENESQIVVRESPS